MTDLPTIQWQEADTLHSALWRSESGLKPPARVIVADDTLKADDAYHLACEGTALLWRGDFQNARQLLQAMARRMDRKPRKQPTSPLEAFNYHRQVQSLRARTLGMLLLPFEPDHTLKLRRAPDVKTACYEAYGKSSGPYVTSLRELLGIIGAHEWRKNGVEIEALGAHIHPHYGVFSPVRGEYLQLIAQAPLSETTPLAFDIGTGTGVIAAVLAKRGIHKIIATDQEPRALTCALDNITRLGLKKQVQILPADLFPEGRAPLIVCNPPWLPARPNSPIESAIYDPESRMLLGFLNGLAAHLEPNGEGWLIMSNFAEHLGLRAPEFLPEAIQRAGLKVLSKTDIKPIHPRTSDKNDPLHAARSAEVTSLWRLGAA